MNNPAAPVFKQLDHLAASRSDKSSIQTLVLKVSSLERAETFLRESGMLGSVGGDDINIDPSRLEGLDVRLVR